MGALGPAHSPWFYRTHDGSEIDLLLAEGGKPVVAIEVKRSTAPSVSRGFGQACNELGITQRWVVCPVHDRFALRQGAQAIGLADLAGVLARETGA